MEHLNWVTISRYRLLALCDSFFFLLHLCCNVCGFAAGVWPLVHSLAASVCMNRLDAIPVFRAHKSMMTLIFFLYSDASVFYVLASADAFAGSQYCDSASKKAATFFVISIRYSTSLIAPLQLNRICQFHFDIQCNKTYAQDIPIIVNGNIRSSHLLPSEFIQIDWSQQNVAEFNVERERK